MAVEVREGRVISVDSTVEPGLPIALRSPVSAALSYFVAP